MSDYQMMNQQQPNFPVNQVPRNLVTVTQIVYFLHGLSIVLGVFSGASIATAFVFGWPSIIAVIINYVKRSDVQGTYLASHFTWQIRTFWYAFWWIIFVWVVGFFPSLTPIFADETRRALGSSAKNFTIFVA